MIGDSPVFIDTDDNFANKGTLFRGTGELWELLTRNNVNTQLIGKEDIKPYKNIVIMTIVNLNRYQPGDNISKEITRCHCRSICETEGTGCRIRVTS